MNLDGYIDSFVSAISLTFKKDFVPLSLSLYLS